MVGRINAIKMVALHRFIYVFQCITVFIPLYYFKNLDSIISSFYLDQQTARISKKKNIYVSIRQKVAVVYRNLNFTTGQPIWMY